MRALSGGEFGSAQRLSATGFVALGLLTFWIYSVLRFSSALDAHFRRRWREIEEREDLKGADAAHLKELHSRGFVVRHAAPRIAAALLACDALLVAWWYVNWIVLGNILEYWTVVGVVGLSSFLFLIAILITMLWALFSVRTHETTELLVHETGAGALLTLRPDLGEEMMRRWERQSNAVVLFLVCTVPIAFFPTFGAHLFMIESPWAHELTLPLLCFSLAAILHIWGTILLVGLYNSHIANEALHVTPNDANAHREVADGTSTQRELVAIMLTDMFGYSKAMERDEAHAYRKLIDHNSIMRVAIEAHRGREIKTIGDAFLVIFRSAIDAVDCAITAQRMFADRNIGKSDDDRILIRIGIHLGDVLITDNDVYGDGVNVAARIEPLAEPGGICVSEPVFEMVRKKLQLDVKKLDGVQLKNIAVAPAVYQIRLASNP